MVASLSKAMSQGALEKYHSQDNYYSQNEGLENSQWQGQFSEHQKPNRSDHSKRMETRLSRSRPSRKRTQTQTNE
jgi:hypothetical protein